MAGQPALATAYQLPFLVRYSPRPLSSGLPVTLRVRAVRETAEAVEEYSAIVTTFAMLASTGALSGDQVPPQEAVDFVCAQPVAHTPVWQFSGARLDDRALVVLVQMLLTGHESHPIADVTFTTTSAAATPLAYDPTVDNPYPPAASQIPFTAFVDPDLDTDATLTIVFERTLTDEDGEAIDAWIMTWAAGTMSGAYGVAPVPPAECGGLFPEEVTVFDDSLELSFTRLRAHYACVDGLVNACVAVHELFVPIREMRVE